MTYYEKKIFFLRILNQTDLDHQKNPKKEKQTTTISETKITKYEYTLSKLDLRLLQAEEKRPGRKREMILDPPTGRTSKHSNDQEEERPCLSPLPKVSSPGEVVKRSVLIPRS